MRFDVAAMTGCAVLVLAFVPLAARRARLFAAACAAQGWVAGVAAAWQGWARGEPALYGLALAAAGAGGVLVPLVLERGAGRSGGSAGDVGAVLPSALGVGAVVLAAVAVQPVTGGVGAREDLGLALSTVLVGLVALMVRRGGVAQAAGFSAAENGLVLVAAGVPGLPAQAVLAVAVALLALGGAAAAFGARVGR